MKNSILSLRFLFLSICLVGGAVYADTLEQRVQSMEPIIGGYPPNLESKEQCEKIKSDYLALKKELDSALAGSPSDSKLLFLRGHLQSMGHNIDIEGAWSGATDDLKALISKEPGNVPALLELGQLWVNSRPDLAKNAENLFRGAQCYHGASPLEDAQRGMFFALYYQGKMSESYNQAQFLHNTWPQNKAYESYVDMARHNLKKPEEPSKETFAMASCGK